MSDIRSYMAALASLGRASNASE